jgi:hypothetical protein
MGSAQKPRYDDNEAQNGMYFIPIFECIKKLQENRN